MAEKPERQRRGRGEGSITQVRKKGENGAKSSLWLGKVTLSPGVRKSVYGSTRDECVRAMRQALTKAEHGEPQGDRLVTVETFLREWLDGPARRRVRPATLRGYSRYVERHLIPHLGKRRLSQLQPEHIDQMLDALGSAKPKPLSPRTQHHARTVLRTALAWGERNGRIARNVAKLSTPPHVARNELRTLTPEEARQLVKVASGDDWGALYVLALDTGLRQGELLGLRWQDVDLDARTLRVVQTRQGVNGPPVFGEPKSASSRRAVAFGTTSAALLTRWRVRQHEQRLKAGPSWQETGLVFTRSNGSPLLGSNVSRRWKHFLIEHELPVVRFHDLRHSSATFLLAAGLPARAVADRLGHSSTRLTQDTYAHLGALRDAAADHMERVIGGA